MKYEKRYFNLGNMKEQRFISKEEAVRVLSASWPDYWSVIPTPSGEWGLLLNPEQDEQLFCNDDEFMFRGSRGITGTDKEKGKALSDISPNNILVINLEKKYRRSDQDDSHWFSQPERYT